MLVDAGSVSAVRNKKTGNGAYSLWIQLPITFVFSPVNPLP
jgi:hypothetical protein